MMPMRPMQAKAIASVAAALFEVAYAPSGLANPTGAQVVAGGVTVSAPSASQMNITQSTANAIVNWNTFSIGSGEAVNIAQPSAQAALLNRVVGNNPSTIAGSLRANGKVFLVNPAGVLFSAGSSVSVGSLVASTLNIADADFLAGNFHFVGHSTAAVRNAGTITAANGGTVALLGGTVSNSGMVIAKLGTVALGAGGDITLDFAGDGLTTIKIDAGAANALLGNTGTLAADGGTVVMSAQTAEALASAVINQQGIVRAQSLAMRNGHIILDGGTNGETLVSGTFDASGGASRTGGQIDVTGYDIGLLAGANINASGGAGGGIVHIGGGSHGADPAIPDANAVWMDPAAQIHADALTSGNGGSIVVYGSTASRVYGALSATGGATGGNGGWIETSGGSLDVTGATINVAAPQGVAGSWLLDPVSIEICAASAGCSTGSGGTLSGSVMLFGPASTPISDQQITTQLNDGTSVTVQTSSGDITVDTGANIAKTAGADATLTLESSGNVVFNFGAAITSSAGKLNVDLEANVNGTAGSNAVTLGGTTVNTNGGTFTIGNTGQSAVNIENSTINTDGGAAGINGTAASGNAVAIGYSLVSTGSGALTVHGTSSAAGNGIDLSQSALQTSNGNIGLVGTGFASSAAASGVTIFGNYQSGPTVTPAIDVTGTGAVSIQGSAGGFDGTGVSLNGTELSALSGPVAVTGTVAASSFGIGVNDVFSAFNTSSGGVTINGSVTASTSATLSGATGVLLEGPGQFFAGSGTITLPTIQTASGAISVTGSTPASLNGSVALDVDAAQIVSANGAITLTGNSTGTAARGASSSGVVLENTTVNSDTVTQPNTGITTGTGTLAIYGSGLGSGVEGVLVADGSTITSNNGGAIDIRGVVTSPTPSTGGDNVQFDYGTLVYNGTVTATAPNSTIALAGSTNTSDAGLALGGVAESSAFTHPAGTVSVSAASGGTVALRAANDNTSTSLLAANATVTSPGGTLAILAASVDPATFALIAQNSTPITLFGPDAGGLSIDMATFNAFTGFTTLALGSDTQTGLIVVDGICSDSTSCTTLSKPVLNMNLTLENPGSGSQGIELPHGISVGNHTLTLDSAGAVTDPGGIQAAGLLLVGPGSFTLNDPQNDVGVLAMMNAGNVNFFNSVGFVIGPIVSHAYDATSGTLTTIDATNSTLTGNLLAQAGTGGIGLGGGTASPGGPTGGMNTNLTAGGTIDLVMENGVFTDNGTGTVSAGNGWRIWAATWNGETRGNVQPNTLQPNFYGCSYGAGCVWGGTVPLTGDHFVYIARPTVIVTADGATRLAGALNPNFAYATSGLINGDTAAGTLAGTLSTPATQGSPAGQYPIDPAFVSLVGYIVVNDPGTLTVSALDPDLPLAQSGLQSFFGPAEKTFVYENNLQGTNICVGSNQPLFSTTPPGENQDLLAVEWKRVRSQPNLNSCMLANGQHGCGDF